MSTTVYYTLPMDALAPDITWSVTTGTVVAAFPLANINDGLPHTIAKITHAGSCIIDGDLGSSIQCGLVVIVAQNIPVGSTVNVIRSDSATFAAGNETTALTIPAVREDGLSVNPFVDLSGVAAKRYIRFDITAATGTEIAIGELRVEARAGTTPRTFARLYQQDAYADETRPQTRTRTVRGVEVVYDYGVTRREGVIPVWKMRDGTTTRDQVLTLLRSVRDNPTAFVFIPDSTINEAWVVTVLDPSSAMKSLLGPTHWVANDLRFSELSAGIPV